jgi:hypothetical protein
MPDQILLVDPFRLIFTPPSRCSNLVKVSYSFINIGGVPHGAPHLKMILRYGIENAPIANLAGTAILLMFAFPGGNGK